MRGAQYQPSLSTSHSPAHSLQSMEILRPSRSLQSESDMSHQAAYYQEDQRRDKYFYHSNQFLKTNQGDKAIREILHLLEDRDRTHERTGAENQVQHYLQHAILCASILCFILIIAILLVHRKHSRRVQAQNNDMRAARDTVIVINEDDTNTIICDNSASSTASSYTNQTTSL